MALRIIATALLSLILAILWPDPGRLTAASPVVSPLSLRDTSHVSACKLPKAPGVAWSSGFSRHRESALLPSTRTLTGFMIFADFKDSRVAGKSSPQQYYNSLVAPAIKYLEQVSYGKFSVNMQVDLSKFHPLPSDAPSYRLRTAGLPEIRKLVRSALRAYQKASDADIPTVDTLYIVLPADAPEIDRSLSVLYDVTLDGEFVARSLVIIGSNPRLYGLNAYRVLAHEILHLVGLSDYYPQTPGKITEASRAGEYVGGWDIMGANGFGPSPDAFAWDKWRLGWLDDDQIICVSSKGFDWFTLTPLHAQEGVKAVVVRLSNAHVLVAEYRARGSVDADTCAPGLLVYVVSNAMGPGEGPVRVIDANPATKGCLGESLNDATLNPSRTWAFTIRDFLFEVPGFEISFQLTDKELLRNVIHFNLDWYD